MKTQTCINPVITRLNIKLNSHRLKPENKLAAQNELRQLITHHFKTSEQKERIQELITFLKVT
jgi:hypothetical protein